VQEAGAAVGVEADEAAKETHSPAIEKNTHMKISKTYPLAAALFSLMFLADFVLAAPDKKTETPSTIPPSPMLFDSPQAAVDSIVKAAENFDVPALIQILGPDSKDLVSTEDQVADKNRAEEFAAKAKARTSFSVDPDDKDLTLITVGDDDFPMPIPLVKEKGKWMFDTKIGRQEILNRRIGADELDAIAICQGYFDAQHEYAETKHGDSKVNEYAQRILSTPGKHDGLAWKNDDGTWGGPIAESIADAIAQGYSDKAKPYHGYYFKILKGQGPAAPLGKMDFVVQGSMIGGFALVAAPAQYRVTGVKTFMIGPNGTVYEKDLGPKTLEIFQSMELYDPDKTWHPTEDQWDQDDDKAKP